MQPHLRRLGWRSRRPLVDRWRRREADNDTTKYKKFDTGKWYVIRVRVTKSRISAWIDKDQMVDEALEGRKISIRSEVEESKPLGIATWKTAGAIRKIEWRKLSDEEAKPEK